MNTIVLFLVFCMSARFFLVFLAKQANKTWLKRMGYLAILPAIGFTVLFLQGTRKIGAFGETVWWGYLRPVHALLYGLFAFYAIQGNSMAWIFLLMDLLVGLTGFIRFHSKELLSMV